MPNIEDSIGQQMGDLIRALTGHPPRDTEDQDQGEQQQREQEPGEVVDMNTRIRRAAGYGDDAA